MRSGFVGAGWTLVSRDEVTWLRSVTLAEDYEKLKVRPTSLFEHMSEEAVEAGFARIEAALSVARRRAPVRDQRSARLPALMGVAGVP